MATVIRPLKKPVYARPLTRAGSINQIKNEEESCRS